MDVGCTLDLMLYYRLRLWAPTSASRAISAVAELLVLIGNYVMLYWWAHVLKVLDGIIMSACHYADKDKSSCLMAFVATCVRVLLPMCNAVVTREIKLFRNYFCLRRRPTEISLSQLVETCLK